MKSKKSKLSKTDKRLKTLAAKTEAQKEALLKQLEKYPIIQLACERAGVGRSTFYSWCKEDNEFAKLADRSLAEGKEFINDLAESKLIRGIQDGHTTFTIFWLKNNHRGYGDKVTHEHKYWSEESELSFTKEEWEAINEALFHIGYASVIKANSKGLSVDIDEMERKLPEAEKIVEKYKATRETEQEREGKRIRDEARGLPENHEQIEKEHRGVILKDFFKKWHGAKAKAQKEGRRSVDLKDFFEKTEKGRK